MTRVTSANAIPRDNRGRGCAKITAAAASRKRSLIVPREHGAWGILLVPLVVGASVGLFAGGAAGGLAPFVLVALSLFWLRTPLESWIGAPPIRARTGAELQFVRRTAVRLAIVAALALIWLFWGGRNRALIWIGGAAAISFLIQAAVKWISPTARSAAQMVGSAGLTSTAPAAYYVATGRLDPIAWSLWAANFLFAVNQIHFVQLRIHATRAASRTEKLASGRGFLAGQVVLMALILAGCAAKVFPWIAALAFLPLLLRGFGWFAVAPKPLAIHALGKRELLYDCIFGVLLIIGMLPR